MEKKFDRCPGLMCHVSQECLNEKDGFTPCMVSVPLAPVARKFEPELYSADLIEFPQWRMTRREKAGLWLLSRGFTVLDAACEFVDDRPYLTALLAIGWIVLVVSTSIHLYSLLSH